jgi:hypothetical protein
MMFSVLYTFIHISDVIDREEYKLPVRIDRSTAAAVADDVDSCRFSSAIAFDTLNTKHEGLNHD